MVAALLVLRLVVNHGTFDFHLARVKIALEICAVILRVPEAPFHKGEQFHLALHRPGILHRDFVHLTVVILRYKKGYPDLNPFPRAFDFCVSHTVAALIKIERPLSRGIARRPEVPVIIQVKISPAAQIKRNIIIAETRDTAKFRILVEAVPSRRI